MKKKRRKNEKPLYLQVTEELTAMIRDGKVKVGQMLPTEQELSRQFDISRHTAREALRRIETMGLVERKRGSGTRVTAQHSPVVYNQFVESLEDLLQYGQATHMSVRESREDRVPAELAGALGCETGTEMVHLSAIRYQRDENPPLALCSTEIWVPQPGRRQREELLDIKRAQRAIYRKLDLQRLSRVRQTLSAEELGKENAGLLDAEVGAAALVISRHYYDRRNRLILLAISMHPSDRFRYSSELTAHRRNP